MAALRIRALLSSDATACGAIVRGLPYHFGNELGRRECAEAVRRQQGLAAVGDDGTLLGFMTMVRHSPETVEITWMAVHADHRRGGIGTALMEHMAGEMASRGVKALFVLTLGPSSHEDVEDSYEGTRRFYLKAGFMPLREFDLTAWDDPALVLVRLLTSH